jgi:hypothetical protein
MPARSVGTVARVARAAWPWLTLYAVSGMLAFAVDRALTSASFDGPRTRAAPTESVQWIILSSVDDAGTRFNTVCIAQPETFAGDTLDVDAADLERLRALLQCQPASTSSLRP